MSKLPRFHSKSSVLFVGLLVMGLEVGPVAAVEETDFRFDTTDDLYHVCATTSKDPNHVVSQVACNAFIEAAVQYHDAVTSRKGLKRLICYPQGATISDGRAAFVAWSEANRANAKRMGEMPVVGLVRALAKAYPCE
ncbi:hypothetical protein Thimo_1362 [Thioflavicoccus mobilis 8321]|uniref:Rap1a immunity protein domain-containing protein n=1 Tax=Thioflavicoccus mobilis 8321 TaxID=765912 RepID=L0GVZ1_9GAMM|nr:Rap1a/Tai family immunity protein [Thioflavicoccus mobilis]AGA90156.1 hypothetical protein Thimo_1362 [Thioflavicoccus mobilis 8321]